MTLIIETEDPGARGVRKVLKEYLKRYPDYTDPLTLYGAIMEIQQEVLESLSCPFELEPGKVEARLREGLPVLEPRSLDVDPEVFRDTVSRICRAVDEKAPEGFARCEELTEWEGLGAEQLPQTRELVLAGDELQPGDAWDSEEKKLASSMLWEALAPFYRKCGSIHQTIMDQAIWQRGYCPVCGGYPLMGLLREDDGLWLVECGLCHTIWNITRARCPFCEGTREGSLDFIYIDEDPGVRAYACEACGQYLKTVDVRESGRRVLLPLEDIVTSELDGAAEAEGLKRPGEFGP